MSYVFERAFLLSYCLACCWSGLGAQSNLHVIKQWAELDFAFPSDEAKQTALNKEHFIPGSSVPIDVDAYYSKSTQKSRIFVTIPRFDKGRPVTLGTVDDQGRIAGYPDYSWHDNQGRNCDGFTSVFRVAIDECNRMWVMDTGRIGDTQHCPPQLFAFNLENDQIIYRHILNSSSYTAQSLFVTPVVDVRPTTPGDCSDTFVYVADVTGFGLLVVDVAHDRSWRVTNKYFFPYPSRGTFTIQGESFDLMDGVLGLALSPYKPGSDRILYFHALASTTENVMRTSTLRNSSNIDNPTLDPHTVAVFPQERPNQSPAEVMDRNGVLFFGIMDPPSIWCWNSATEFSKRNFHKIALDAKTLQFASGVKIVNNLKGEQELWILTCRFQKVMTGSISAEEINYRILAERVSVLLANTPCVTSAQNQSLEPHANIIYEKSLHDAEYIQIWRFLFSLKVIICITSVIKM